MEILFLSFVIIGIFLLIIAAVVSGDRFVFVLIAAGICLVLFSNSKTKELKKGGNASSLNVLTKGEKYEIVGIYEKYIIIKSANEKLRLIGPLDFGTRTITTGRYVKTQESLDKIE